jgi:hypothetical protein
MTDIPALIAALRFAADAHANQRRKGAGQEPYINHLIEVLHLVIEGAGTDDIHLLQAALLHDVVEDTAFTKADIAARFGPQVADIVMECSDDMSLPREERRRRRIEAATAKSAAFKTVKAADMISNLRALLTSPPAGWPPEWRLGYAGTVRRMAQAIAGAAPNLDRTLARELERVEQALRAEEAAEGPHAPARTDGERLLAAEAGQPVHLVYMANTEAASIGEPEREKLAGIAQSFFPSVTMQDAEGIYEGRRRAILLLRIRTDDTNGVVALASRVCEAFGQRFVGVEVDGRYVRIYAGG